MEILTERIGELLEEMRLAVEVPRHQPGESPGAADLMVRLPTATGSIDVRVEVKNRAQPLGPAEVEQWIKRVPGPTILALPHVTPAQGRRYRAAGLQYVDSGGNAYISHPGFHVHIEGRRPGVAGRVALHSVRPSLNTSGLKLVFTLLIAPGVAGAPYEHLAHVAGVSKGTVNNTINDLRRAGFVVGDRGERRMVDGARLAREWVDGYARGLLPRLKSRSLNGPPPEWWVNEWAPSDGAVLAGGLSLQHFGAPLRPSTTVLYGVPPWLRAVQEARLTRDGQPNVTLRERFWSTEIWNDSRFVPPLLAYADALAEGDSREVEVARNLWDRGDGLLAIEGT